MLRNTLFQLLVLFTTPLVYILPGSMATSSASSSEESSEEDTCARIHRRCLRHLPEKQPVCGTDGKTYSTICRLRYTSCWLYESEINISLDKSFDGPCQVTTQPPGERAGTLPPTLAPTTRPPVVDGGGGGLLPNGGSFPREAPTEGPTTPTSTTPCSQFCPLVSDPVCGTDGNTYISPCLLEVQACMDKDPGLIVSYAGVCENVQSKHNENKTQACPRVETCPLLYLPVCGSDGLTYQSECHLLAKACTSKDTAHRNLRVNSVGECPDTSPPKNCGICSEIWDPVCGFDNVTYFSECHLRQYACQQGLLPYLKVAYRDICKAGLIECPDYCKVGVNDPICGTDGNTYPSLCFLAFAACVNNDKTLTLKHRGECSSDPCQRTCPQNTYQPVCSTAGDTYQNDCFLWVAMCKDSSLLRAGPDDVNCNLAIP